MSSLTAFNKKIADMKQGIPIPMETDEIEPCQVTDTVDSDPDELELVEEQSESVLHEEPE
jgi:hypothetical protein